MKTIKYIAFYSILSSLFLTSCTSGDDNVDTEPPVIVLTGPKEGAKLEAGKDVHFAMDVSDNVALGSYNIDIHDNFDGHGHNSLSVRHSDSTSGDDHNHDNNGKVKFKFNRTWDDIHGKRNDHVHHHEIIIKEDAMRGPYHFVVKVVDKAGNQSMVFRNVEIVDPGQGDNEHDHDHAH